MSYDNISTNRDDQVDTRNKKKDNDQVPLRFDFILFSYFVMVKLLSFRHPVDDERVKRVRSQIKRMKSNKKDKIRNLNVQQYNPNRLAYIYMGKHKFKFHYYSLKMAIRSPSSSDFDKI